MVKAEDYKVLSSRIAFKGWVSVREEDIQLPDGKIQKFHFMEKGQEGVVVLPVTKEKEVIMIKQFRVPEKKVFTELVAGLIDEGEEPIETAKRELEEETGYTAHVIEHLVTHYPIVGLTNYRSHIFFATDIEKLDGQKLDEAEFIEVLKVPLEEFKKIVMEGNIEGSMLLAYFYAKERGFI